MSSTSKKLYHKGRKENHAQERKEAAAVGSIPIEPVPLKLYAIPFPAYLNYSTLCLVCQEAQFIGINQPNK